MTGAEELFTTVGGEEFLDGGVDFFFRRGVDTGESFVASKYLPGVFLTRLDDLGGVAVLRAVRIIDRNRVKV